MTAAAGTADPPWPPPLTVLSLNIHMGRSMFKRRHVIEELRAAIRTVAADLVFLQEAVGAQADTSIAPQYEFLGETVWGDRAYGRNAVYSDGHHGNAILSKYPLTGSVNHDISVPSFEPRGLLHGVVAVPGWTHPLHAVCTHLGLDAQERERQIGRLRDLVADQMPAQAPVIAAGDFNDWRQRAGPVLAQAGLSESFATLRGRPARSFPARLPLLRLDRVYTRGLKPVSAQVLSARPWSHLSDHAGLVVTVRR